MCVHDSKVGTSEQVFYKKNLASCLELYKMNVYCPPIDL